MNRENLKRLLRPRHIAYIGGESSAPGIEGALAGGFDGPVWSVNPKRRSIAGLPCFASVADLPEPPDASFIWVPREATIETVRELAAVGAGGAVCYAAGFAEVDGGADHQERLVEAAGDFAAMGPNCHVAVNIASQGRNAVMTGDLMHSPVQLAHPEWSPNFDFDPALSAETRRRFLDSHCETDTLVLTAHFPSPSVGHVAPHAERAFDFEYEPTTSTT